MTCGVYKIGFSGSEDFYIGGSANIEKRVKYHLLSLRKGEHHSFLFQEKFKEIGESGIFTLILEECEYSLLKKTEQKHLDELNPTLNISRTAKCGDLISYHPKRDEIVKKIKQSSIDRFTSMTAEGRAQKHGLPGESNGMFGRTHTKESKRLISEAMTGNQFSAGRKWSEKQRESHAKFAKTWTGERNPFFGKTHTIETRKSISEKNKGKKPKNSRRIIVNGKIYESATECGRQLEISTALVLYRIKKSPKFGSYSYVD